MLYSLMQVARRIRGEINEVVARFNNPRAVQGVTIEYDSYWIQHLKQWITYPWPWPHPEESHHWMKWVEQFLENPESFKPPFWNDYLKTNGLGEGGPVIVTFVLRDPRALDQVTENVQGALKGFQVRVEYRPQARGYTMTAGVSTRIAPATVGVTTPHTTNGTLGGLLKDRSRPSKQYIVSCAHVLSDTSGTDVYLPSPANAGHALIGNVSFGVMPPSAATGIQCSKSTTVEHPLDAAAAELLQTVSIPTGARPKVDGVKPIKLMWKGDAVWFTGAASGRVTGQIRSLCIWYEIEIHKQLHCFGNIFEIEPPKPWYVNTDLAKPGDSGAWILSTDGFSIDWNGMLIGGDGAIVFCSFAEKIMDEFRKAGVNATVL